VFLRVVHVSVLRHVALCLMQLSFVYVCVCVCVSGLHCGHCLVHISVLRHIALCLMQLSFVCVCVCVCCALTSGYYADAVRCTFCFHGL